MNIALSDPVKAVLKNDTVMMLAGSRDLSQNRKALLRGARVAVETAHQEQWALICGDAIGIDAEVIRTADILNVPIAVFGVTRRPRNGGSKSGIYQELPGLTFAARDKFMVQLADRCTFIWNGSSKGTLAAYLFAKRMDVLAYMFEFDHE